MRVLIVDFNIVRDMLSGKSVLDFAMRAPKSVEFQFFFNRTCDLSDELINNGFKCTIFEYGVEASRFLRVFSFLGAVVRMAVLTLKIKPDVLHANNLMSGRLVSLVGKLTRTPSVVQLRNPYVPARQSWVLDMCDRVYCVSKYIKENVISAKQARKAVVVYDGFDIECPQRIDIPKKPNHIITIGLCSRVSYQKGVHLFCNLAKSYADAENINFIHLGGAKFEEDQDSYELGLKARYSDYVEWLSYSDTTTEFFKSIDIFLLPAVEDEAFGRVLVEAMLHGLPCVSTLCGGPEEIIINGQTGFLVEAQISTLKKILDDLIGDVNLRSRIGINALHRAKNDFSIELYTKNLIENYPVKPIVFT